MQAPLFSDRNLLVINKPVGIPVIPGRDGGDALVSPTGPYANHLVCHRLDTDTSGCLVLAKTAAAHRIINLAFQESRIEKTYLARVTGTPPDQFHSELSIGPWRRGRVIIGKAQQTGGDWKTATTRFRVLSRFPGGALIEATPLTGRTHQIRAHLAAAGYPIDGDPTYGGPPAERLFLHASKLVLPWPKAENKLTILAPTPDGFGPPAR